MLTKDALTDYFGRAFTKPQSALLSEVIAAAQADLVKTSDFNELKEIVRDLGQSQKRTEKRVEELTTAQERTEQRMGELASAQERTEQRMGELASAQARTEQRVEELASAQASTDQHMKELASAQASTDQHMKELASAQGRTDQHMKELAAAQKLTEKALLTLSNGLNNTRSELAGLSRSFSYALENEAYRALPNFLREQHNIELTQRFIRTYIGEQEVNLLAEGRQNGEPVLIVGEAKSHLGTDDFPQLQANIRAVEEAQAAGELPAYRILPIFIAHVARPAALRRAAREGVIIVQSFEW